MVQVYNVNVYDLEKSIVASGYAMGTQLEEFDGRSDDLKYWLSFGDFLPKFTEHYYTQNKNIGKNTADSCLKCGSNLHVQRVNKGNGGGNYYCGKHCHELYRYGEIIDDVTYTFLNDYDVEIKLKGDFHKVHSFKVSALDLPLVFGKHLHVCSGYLFVGETAFHNLIKHRCSISCGIVDHINRDKTDNRRDNLRFCTEKQNLLNKTGVNGICFSKEKNKWRSYITVNGKRLYHKYFDNKEDAIKYRLEKECELFGEFSPNIHLFEKYGIKPTSLSRLEDGYKYRLQTAMKDFRRLVRLSCMPNGSGHQSALCGIRVAFDIKYPAYFSPELQRYHFNDIVCSSSKMHRLVNMNMDLCFNEYVTEDSKSMMKNLIQIYNRDKSYENFMKVVSNCPLGIELFMRCTTNYLQLRTIYHQRKSHKLLDDWQEGFCKNFIEKLPYFNEFIKGEK